MGVMRYEDLYKAVKEVCLFPRDKYNQLCGSKNGKAVRAVFSAIKKGLERDGHVTIEGFGRFYLGKKKNRGNTFVNGKYVVMKQELSMFPIARFRPCVGLRHALRDEEDGD
jgi:nucleoid DNA-binding protein